MMMMCYDLMCT